MNLIKQTLATLALTAGLWNISNAQSELQVIHNCADPAASVVDIYVNGTLAIPDFEFRKATPFISLPSGVQLEVGVAPGNSASVNDTLVNFSLTLNAGEKYVAIASGVLNPASFSVNPDGIATGFGLTILANAQTASMMGGNVDLAVNHGSIDAPAVDVIARGVATLVDGAAYGDVTGYLGVPAGNYILDITPDNDNNTIVASYQADITALAGGAGVAFASGFLNPAANQNGEAFGLFVALPSGAVVQLPQVSQARLQVIHNAADPAAASVDIYLNGTLSLDNFAFRTATPFIDVPAGVDVNIGVAPGTSTSANDTLVNFTVQFTNGQTYIAVANGVLAPASFAANPDGISTGFTLFVSQDVRESALNPAEVDLKVVHGSSDAPTVDVIARNVATLVDNAFYGAITPYISVPPASYLLDVTPGNANNTIVASYTADLSTLGGASAVVFASGFLNPATNQNGAAFGLFAALPSGAVVQLPQTSQARLQVIHNAADPAAASVDVYLNGTLALDNFGFRTATPFINVPGDVNVNIGIAPGTSTSINDTITSFNVQFTNGETYVALANGVLAPASFAANPDGISTAFTLLLQSGIRESALTATDVDFIGIHGATDAPTVDIQVSGGPILIDDAAYTDITGYLTVPAGAYPLEVTPGNNNSVVVASYIADLSSLGGGSAVVFASGFLNPSANQNGEAFGLYAALADGTVVPFSITTSISEPASTTVFEMYPNPVNRGSELTIRFSDTNPKNISITDLQGRTVQSIALKGNETQATITTGVLANGIYQVRIEGENGIQVSKFIVQ